MRVMSTNRSQPNTVYEAPEIVTGCSVRVLSVSSCMTELPEDDQARLLSIVGRLRKVARIDAHGFVWLSFDEGCQRDDFCLMPAELEVV
jgi:hypothetical protein